MALKVGLSWRLSACNMLVSVDHSTQSAIKCNAVPASGSPSSSQLHTHLTAARSWIASWRTCLKRWKGRREVESQPQHSSPGQPPAARGGTCACSEPSLGPPLHHDPFHDAQSNESVEPARPAVRHADPCCGCWNCRSAPSTSAPAFVLI